MCHSIITFHHVPSCNHHNDVTSLDVRQNYEDCFHFAAATIALTVAGLTTVENILSFSKKLHLIKNYAHVSFPTTTYTTI